MTRRCDEVTGWTNDGESRKPGLILKSLSIKLATRSDFISTIFARKKKKKENVHSQQNLHIFF